MQTHMWPTDYIKHHDLTLDELRNRDWFHKLTPQQKITQIWIWVDNFNNAIGSIEIVKGGVYMAKKNFNQFSTKFAAIRLDAAEKKNFLKWKAENSNDGDVYYVELVRAGWKGSQSYDAENDCFIWSLTQRNERDINYDICVSSRSDNMYEAMLLGIYKLLVLYPEQKLPTESPRDNWG